MKSQEVKKLIVSWSDSDHDAVDIAGQLEAAGVCFDFREDLYRRVIDRIPVKGILYSSEMEFVRKLNSAFYRVALTGVAAIVLLLISIFLMEGSLSINSFLGIGNTYDESIVCLLTGN